MGGVKIYIKTWYNETEVHLKNVYFVECRVSVGITVDAPVTALSNKTNDIQCFKDI